MIIEQWGCGNNCAGPAQAVPLQRSKTALVVTDSRPQMYVDLERQARTDAEKAMKVWGWVFSNIVNIMAPRPTYIISSTTIYQHARCDHRTNCYLLTVPWTALALSTKAFSVSAASVWNSLSYSVCMQHCASRATSTTGLFVLSYLHLFVCRIRKCSRCLVLTRVCVRRCVAEVGSRRSTTRPHSQRPRDCRQTVSC